MRFHQSVVERLVKVFETYGGHKNENKLKDMLSALDLTTYERQSTGEELLVLTEDFEREAASVKASTVQSTFVPNRSR